MITKTTMVVIFNLPNSHLLTLSLPTKEVFQVNGQNRPVANLPVVDFHSQPREMLTPKPLNTQLPVFLLVYWFFSPSRKVWTSQFVTVCQRYGYFSVLAATIRERSDKWPCIENREDFAIHSSTWPSGAKGEWRISSWLATSTHVEKIRYFFTYVVTAFLRAGNPCIAPQFMW